LVALQFPHLLLMEWLVLMLFHLPSPLLIFQLLQLLRVTLVVVAPLESQNPQGLRPLRLLGKMEKMIVVVQLPVHLP
jgi:hypothetical protein